MRRFGAVLAVAVLVAGCSAGERPTVRPPRAASIAPAQTATSATVSASPSPSQGSSPGSTGRAPRPDPRWRFFTDDRRPRTSRWFAGAHPVMIGYGCTVAPYYGHDPRCPGRQGFHHGVDVAMPCGTRLFSAVRGTVVDPASAGAPGAAYGPYAFRIRTGAVDVLIGHVRKVYVDPGDAVRPGQLVARANDQGAPDGCHLHLEVRRAGTGLSGAIDPAPYLRLRVRTGLT